MKKVVIEFVPQSEQRYDTIGDWYYELDGDLTIKVTHDGVGYMGAGAGAVQHYAALVGIHELVEAMLCHVRGIPQALVDEFDLSHSDSCEPGDDPRCPYRREHRFAMLIEHMVAHEMGLRYGEVL